MRLIKLLAVLLLLAGLNANAFAEWKFDHHSRGKYNYSFYINTDIEKNGDIRRVSTLTDLDEPGTQNGVYFSSIEDEFEINCTKKERRQVGIVFYSQSMGKGEQLHQDYHIQNWEEVPIFRKAQDAFDAACK